MFLDIPGMVLPKNMRLHRYTDVPMADGKWGGQRPKHLVPLEKSLWPEEVIEKIATIYKAHGLANPRKQKLVEPYAREFGGKNKQGESDLSKVDWELVVEYFEWEAEAIMDTGKAKALQEAVIKKRGSGFWHYPVYENPNDKSWVKAVPDAI